MVPATDRATKFASGWFWPGMGLALCLGNLGCTRLMSQRQDHSPAVLGRLSDTNDIYAEAHRPRSTATVPGAMSTEIKMTDPTPVSVDEVGLAMRPAEPSAEAAPSGVALQPPAPLDARPASRSASATMGVPNGSRILAASERRADPDSQPKPAEIVTEARAALDAMANYQVSMHRQERVNGSLLPEEDVVLAVRRDPKAVRLTWPSGPNQGREVLYRSDEPGGQMHVKMANPALPRLSLSPESPMVMRNSRHPVTEAGFASLVEGLENALKAPAASSISYAGLEAAEGLDRPHHCLVRTSPSGERWRIYLDPGTHLPSLLQATDSGGELLERYLFRDVRSNLPELASAEAFDANSRWGQPRGLFGRIARGDSPDTPPSPR